jgi:hypothetical protein
MCFVWISEQTAIISLYSINWMVFNTETECVYCAVRDRFLYNARFNTNSTFCPHSVFMCFVWIWKQTAVISLYSINWLVFITETECVYCAVRAKSLNTVQVVVFTGVFKCCTIMDLRPKPARFESLLHHRLLLLIHAWFSLDFPGTAPSNISRLFHSIQLRMVKHI